MVNRYTGINHLNMPSLYFNAQLFVTRAHHSTVFTSKMMAVVFTEKSTFLGNELSVLKKLPHKKEPFKDRFSRRIVLKELPHPFASKHQ